MGILPAQAGIFVTPDTVSGAPALRAMHSFFITGLGTGGAVRTVINRGCFIGEAVLVVAGQERRKTTRDKDNNDCAGSVHKTTLL